MEDGFLEELIDGKRSSRAVQKAIGPSEIGGCRRKVWHRLQQTPIVNHNTWQFPSFSGTAIHKELERRVRARDLHDRYEVEIELEFNGLKGHVDVYDKQNREVIDWKTTTKDKLNSKDKPWPYDEQWWQVQLYGYLLVHNGYPG